VQDEVNQDYSEQNEVDGMKKGADFRSEFTAASRGFPATAWLSCIDFIRAYTVGIS